jgi:hypothetical protein
MCITLIYDDYVLTSIGDAKVALGKNNVIISDGYNPHTLTNDCCLCPLDIRATAKKLGRRLRQDKFDTMEYELVKRVPRKSKG